MEHDSVIIEIDGEEIDDLIEDLVQLEVELDDEMASLFRLKLSMPLLPDGAWSHLDDERLRVWKSVAISGGFESGAEELISGYITHVKPSFSPCENQVALEIWGMDASVLLDREEKLKDWPNKKDSDIAQEIFSLYSLSAEVEDTAVIHDEAISTILQRDTDMQFLKRLALRNGYECFVDGTTGYFRSPALDDDPQPLLAAHFGDETTLGEISLEVNALAPAQVAMFQIDRTSKEIIEATANASQQTLLGEIDAEGLLPPGTGPGLIHVGRNGASGPAEMTALCQGLFHEAEWFVTVQGEVAANNYGHVLRPRRTVTIKGIGETYSGIYYVTHVTHSFGAGGYAQKFCAKRNAILPSGNEDFESAGRLDGLL